MKYLETLTYMTLCVTEAICFMQLLANDILIRRQRLLQANRVRPTKVKAQNFHESWEINLTIVVKYLPIEYRATNL